MKTKTSPRRHSRTLPTESEISERARMIHEHNGRKPGRDIDNWLQAEAELQAEAKATPRQRRKKLDADFDAKSVDRQVGTWNKGDPPGPSAL